MSIVGSLLYILVALTMLVTIIWIVLIVFAYWPNEPEVPVSKFVTEEDRFVTVEDLKLRYRRYGTPGPNKPQLLLIHGFANSLASYRRLAPLLAENGRCEVVAIDMAGFGLSDKTSRLDYRHSAEARRMVSAARSLGLARPIYVGHSLGGAVALHASVLDPKAAGLILANPGIVSTGVPKIVGVDVQPLPRLWATMFGRRSVRAASLRKSFADPDRVTDEIIDDVMIGARSEGYTEAMTSFMKQYPWQERERETIDLMKRVKVPALILWGDLDAIKTPEEANEIHSMLKGSEIVHFPKAGHYSHEEDAEGVAKAMKKWLRARAA